MRLIKDVESKIKLTKTLSLSIFALSIVIVVSGFYFAYKFIDSQNKNIYILDNGVPVMAPTGHFHIKKTIKENNALLGGEMSGHIFFNDKWYGFDDGPYSGARIIEALSEYPDAKSISDIMNTYPKSFSTPELNIDVTDENKFQIIEDFIDQNNLEGEENTIDGLRVNYENGWGLIRASNTSPKLVLRFEGNSIEDMHYIQNEFLSELARISPDIVINLT